MSEKNDVNKTNLKWFGKAIILCALIFTVLIPNVEIWNMAYHGYTDTFHVIMSIINFVVGSGGIAYFAKTKLDLKQD